MSLSSLSLLCNLPLVENTQLFKRPDNVIGQSEAKHSNASIPFFQRFCYYWSAVHHSQCCTTAAKIGGIPHRAEQWLREKHVSESDLKIWNIQLAIHYFSMTAVKIGEFPIEHNDSTVCLLVLGKWCSTAHSTVDNRQCNSWEHPLHFWGGDWRLLHSACTTNTLLPLWKSCLPPDLIPNTKYWSNWPAITG